MKLIVVDHYRNLNGEYQIELLHVRYSYFGKDNCLMKPLDNIRILDLSRILAGPYCTMMLSDMGAEVIKIESPGKGDDTRAFGPPFVEGESSYFLSVNRNKKSVTLNLKSKKGKEILKKLVAKSDILVENFRPGTLDKLGFGYDKVKKINPRIIYCSVSGYGQTGPKASLPGYDLVVQGESGMMSITGFPDMPPVKVGTSIADIVAGMLAAQGILLALYNRQRTGDGQMVDVSLLEGQVALLTYQAGIYFATGKSPERKGNQHPTIVPYETFRTKDGYINIAVGNDTLWQKFCDVINMENLVEESKFSTNEKRVVNHDELKKILEPKIVLMNTEDLLEMLMRVGIPCGSVKSIDEVCNDPQVLAREMVVELQHPNAGSIKVTGVPIKLSETPGRIETPPPTLGQHTDQILEELLGYSEDEITVFRETRVI